MICHVAYPSELDLIIALVAVTGRKQTLVRSKLFFNFYDSYITHDCYYTRL